uniref:Uncharacterized protein n=1 Tax=Eutreptiella gymnastica TaxID=73025 RepID=A0A7S1N1T2_9EUGL
MWGRLGQTVVLQVGGITAGGAMPGGTPAVFSHGSAQGMKKGIVDSPVWALTITRLCGEVSGPGGGWTEARPTPQGVAGSVCLFWGAPLCWQWRGKGPTQGGRGFLEGGVDL